MLNLRNLNALFSAVHELQGSVASRGEESDSGLQEGPFAVQGRPRHVEPLSRELRMQKVPTIGRLGTTFESG